MKKILIETSNSFSNVFIGMNSFFQKKHNVRLINCNGALINKIIDKTQGIWKPKLYKSGMSLMPGFHTGLARNNLTWIHDTLHNNELMVFGKKTGRFNYFKEFINNLSKKSEYIITPSLYSKNKLIADLKINDKNIANKTEVKTGLRSEENIEIISGLSKGDVIAAEGLKKVRPKGKIKPINK